MFALAWLIMRTGRVRAASWLLATTLWLILLSAVLVSGGAKSPILGGFVAAILFSGMLLGWRGGVVYAALSSAAGFAIAGAQQAGASLPALITYSETSRVLVASAYFAFVIVLLYLATENLNQALERARCELEERERAEAEVRRLHTELQASYNNTLEGWALTLELRDKETTGHSRRVTELAVALGRRLGVSEEALEHLRRGALLHDIGKMAISNTIIQKAGPLTEEEWLVMRKHPEIARSLLANISFLEPALDVPYSHHEKWDGSGYPNGLKGEEIPLAARIFALADYWDAVTHDRPYHKAWPRQQAVDFIRAESGKYFDPALVAPFLEIVEEDDGTE
jgi:putative nucleotidyltransferase with HDIG domain